MQRPDDSSFDQASEFPRPDVTPAQVLTALITVTERPRIPWKPRVFEGGLSRLAAAQGLRERNNLKPKPCRVREREFVFAAVLEPVLLIRDPIKAPRAQPVSSRILNGRDRPVGNGRFNDPGNKLLASCLRPVPVHSQIISRPPMGGQTSGC
jgi:hypothetical protein